MFPDPVSHTSLLTAAARAAESRRPNRLFDDPHAATLAGAGGEALLAEVGVDTAAPSIAIRTRYYDDVVVDAVARGIHQVVLLGAGLDARAYRLPLPASVRWLEVDRAPVLEYKRGLLAGARARVALRDVPGDASEASTFAALEAAGLATAERSLWLVEGLLCFLGEDEIRALFDRLRASSPPGSEVIFDVPNLAAVNAQGGFARAGSALLKRGLRFGTDDPRGMARSMGLDVIDVVHDGHPRAHYGRRVEPAYADVSPERWTVFFIHARTP